MQGAKPPSALSFELSNVTKWEYVLLDKDSAVGEYANDEEDGEDGAALASARQAAAEAAEAAVEPAEGDDEKLELDMPPSWVAKLNIPRARYEGRTPAGMKATLYRKARLEKFAAYSLDSGMVERLTVFSDALCLQPVESARAPRRRPLRSSPSPHPRPPPPTPSSPPRPPLRRSATRSPSEKTSWPSGSSSRRGDLSSASTPGGRRGCASTCSSRV